MLFLDVGVHVEFIHVFHGKAMGLTVFESGVLPVSLINFHGDLLTAFNGFSHGDYGLSSVFFVGNFAMEKHLWHLTVSPWGSMESMALDFKMKQENGR